MALKQAGSAVCVAVPADAETVSVGRGRTESGMQALVDDGVHRFEQQLLGSDRVTGVGHPSAHGVSQPRCRFGSLGRVVEGA